MTWPAGASPWPGLRRARLSDAPAIATVEVASWRTTYGGIVPEDYLSRMTAEEHAERWARLLARPGSLDMTFVVEEEDRVVGFAKGGPEREGDLRFVGELYAIYLLEEVQRQGHGRALAEAVAEALLRRGLRSMLVWVLRDNLGARRFYESLGGVYLRQHDLDFGAGFTLPEVSYGWSDLRLGLHPPPR
jgi:ribosomal protein S18 acetylase RimI-like enzyme